MNMKNRLDYLPALTGFLATPPKWYWSLLQPPGPNPIFFLTATFFETGSKLLASQTDLIDAGSCVFTAVHMGQHPAMSYMKSRELRDFKTVL